MSEIEDVRYCQYRNCRKELSRISNTGRKISAWKYARKEFCDSSCARSEWGAQQRDNQRDADELNAAIDHFIYGGNIWPRDQKQKSSVNSRSG